jgi:hypothetical protein
MRGTQLAAVRHPTRPIAPHGFGSPFGVAGQSPMADITGDGLSLFPLDPAQLIWQSCTLQLHTTAGPADFSWVSVTRDLGADLGLGGLNPRSLWPAGACWGSYSIPPSLWPARPNPSHPHHPIRAGYLPDTHTYSPRLLNPTDIVLTHLYSHSSHLLS